MAGAGLEAMEDGMDGRPLESDARERAWGVLEACGAGGQGLRAAADSRLYPHVWTRDACLASLGILVAHRGDADLEPVVASLRTVARHQDELGRIPLKVDLELDAPVAENSAGVDGGLWYAITVDALARHGDPGLAEPFVETALRALHWCLHLDVNGCGLLESPEASDWADMLPHRHNVLTTNVLFFAALGAGARMSQARGEDERARRLDERAGDVKRKVNLLFWPTGCTDAAGISRWLGALEAEHPEWSRTGAVLAPRGEVPFYLPYVGFRTAGRHCDVTGNLLAIVTGLAPAERAASILEHLDRIGASEPYPTRAIDPPIYPGDPDWREYFGWRDLNLPHRYQNGGIWPFIGGLHVTALVHAGRRDEAIRVLERLVAACADGDRWSFPEWLHGQTGRSMGEVGQAWSASGLLWALGAIEGREALWPDAIYGSARKGFGA